MRFRDVGLSLFGGAVVYVAMAACSAGGNGATGGGVVGHGGHGGGGTGHGGTSPSSGGPGGDSGLLDAIADALTDPVPDAKADPIDGSRLKAYYRTGSDGSKEAVAGRWFDSQRNEDCFWQTAADGVTRCMPAAGGLTAFADNTCTMLLAYTAGCATFAYATWVDPTAACTSPPHIYPVGAAVSTPTKIYTKMGASCLLSAGVPSGFTWHSLGAEVPASSFVGSTLAHD